jgi:hypothetical protein
VTALSCVSVPISPRQQRHLAFISEFNVQMLYLPGLKNVVADFLSCHSPPPPPWNLLKQSPPQWRRIQSILKLWLPSKIAVQKCSACSAVHPSNLLFASRRSTPCWRCFNRRLSPNCPRKILKRHFFPFANIPHPGRLARRMVSFRFVWRGLTNDIIAWPRACLHCQ